MPASIAPPPIRSRKVFFVLYDRLCRQFGPQRWWPADSAWEMMLGAILVQNTAWTNVTTLEMAMMTPIVVIVMVHQSRSGDCLASPAHLAVISGMRPSQ